MGEVFPLHYAAASGDLVMIEKLVNDDNVDVNTQIDIYFTTTPLDWAVAHKSLSAVAKLLYLGARVRMSCKIGTSMANLRTGELFSRKLTNVQKTFIF